MKNCIILASGDQRTKLVKINILLGVGVRGVSVLSSLLLVPLTISYISSELYGIWLTLSSVIHWIGFFDIGFGNGLRNRLSESLALGKYKKGKIYVSTAYMMMSIIFVMVAIITCFGATFVNWASLLNVSLQYNDMLIDVAQILLVSFSVQMILKLVQNVTQAYQLNALASFMDTLGNILALIFIYILTMTMAPDMTYIAIVFSLSPLLVFLLASFVLYLGKFKKVSPHIGFVRLHFAKEIFSLGIEFFIIQIAGLVLYQMINILISRLCGPEQVTIYNIAYKYLSVALMIVNVILAPLWSAFTDAYVKGDIKWMKKIYKRLIQMFLFSCVAILMMVVVSPWIYQFWIGDNVSISLEISALVGIYVIIAVWGNIHGTLINGMGKIRFQTVYSIIIMMIFLPMTLFLGHVLNMMGILLSMILVNVPGIISGRYQVIQLMNGSAKGIWNK